VSDDIFFINDASASARGVFSSRRLSLALLACAIASVIAAGFFYLRSSYQELSRAYHCENNLTQIGTALTKYQAVYGTLPPAVTYDAHGKPAHSWRALILPYLQDGKYAGKYDFDEPWDGPKNRKLAALRIEEYACPNSPNFGKDGVTSYVAVIGPATAFPPAGASHATSAITDGGNDTILIVETATLAPQWSEPKDLDWDTMSFVINAAHLPSISGRDQEGVHVLKVNGSVATLPDDLKPSDLKAYLTINGKELVDPF